MKGVTMYTPEDPEIYTRNDHAGEEFMSTAAAAFTGAVIGTWLDNNTRFGHWINHSPAANAMFAILKMTAIVVAAGLGLLYLYFLIAA
jgi:hypothetical protein